jgi:hypothetical protein
MDRRKLDVYFGLDAAHFCLPHRRLVPGDPPSVGSFLILLFAAAGNFRTVIRL